MELLFMKRRGRELLENLYLSWIDMLVPSDIDSDIDAF